MDFFCWKVIKWMMIIKVMKCTDGWMNRWMDESAEMEGINWLRDQTSQTFYFYFGRFFWSSDLFLSIFFLHSSIHPSVVWLIPPSIDPVHDYSTILVTSPLRSICSSDPIYLHLCLSLVHLTLPTVYFIHSGFLLLSVLLLLIFTLMFLLTC